MWKRLLLVVLIACGNKSDKPGDPTQKNIVPVSTGSGSGSAAVPAVAKPGKPAARAKLTKAQLAEVRTHLKAGWAAQKKKQWPDAVTAFEAALKIADGDPRLLSELGWSAMNAGDLAKAKAADEHAVRSATDLKVKAAGLFNLGLVQQKLGDTAAARTSFAASLVLRPNKTVEAELAKLGGAESADCPADKSPCYCATTAVVSSPTDEDVAACAESSDKSPVPGWKIYTVKAWHGTTEELLDERHQVVTAIGGFDDHGRHSEYTTLEKSDRKTVAGHAIIWLEARDEDSSQSMDGQEVMDVSSDVYRVTICTIGDAKTPTHCGLVDAPRITSHTVNRSTMLDDGTIKDNGHDGEQTETTLDITLGDDGTITVKLSKGETDVVPSNVIGTHKLW